MMAAYWSGRTRALGAVVTAGLFTGTVAANLLVVGEILRVFLDVRPAVGIGALAVLVVGYTVLGGFPTVVWTDSLQTVPIVAAQTDGQWRTVSRWVSSELPRRSPR